ncbi:MAG: hypothetical protein M1434_06620 [Chloroflexi bacterium]|nr:hypothetical protein [Chloroflexota bacterium]MCL5274405.1 hypothetical protein [Chloroflexota bacterium]
MPTLADTLQRLPLWINAIKVVYWPREDGQVYSIADFYDRLTEGDTMAHKAEATIALIAALYFEQADESAFDTLPEFMTVLADMINGQTKSEIGD